MKKLILFIFGISLFTSCSQKVYFFDAVKAESQPEDLEIEVDAYFGGDALEYVVFEVDVKNNSLDTLYLNNKDIYLKVYDDNNTIILDAKDKTDIIYELESRGRQLDREKRGRDIGNAISIGLDLLLIGTGNGNGAELFIYSAETASYMMEDARSHKLIKGSLEEQIGYIDEWVLYREKLAPNSEESWDVLFDRQLFESDADFVIEIGSKIYKVPFILKTIEEKVR